MSEHKLAGGEHLKHAEAEPAKEAEKPVKHHETGHEHAKEHSADELESIARKIAAEARSGHEVKVEEKPAQHQPVYVNQKLKDDALNTTLRGVRSHLSPIQRAFSKTVHQPVVDKVSELGAKTVARPVSLLTAGFVALLGSSFALYMAHHYGFRYNLFLFFALLISGYLLGLIIEAVRFLLSSKR